MRKINKKIGLSILLTTMAVCIPSKAFATNVRVRTEGPASTNVFATIQAEKNVTTVADLKQILTDEYDVNFDEYMVINNYYGEMSDTSVICGSDIACYDSGENEYAYLDLIPVDSTEQTVTLKSIAPKDENMFMSISETNYEKFEDMYPFACNETFTKCKGRDSRNYKIYSNLNIVYQSDDNIKKLADAAIESGLLEKTSFKLTDTELLNYINYGGSLADYCSEFKNQLSNLNFRFEMDQRGGSFEPFKVSAIGFYKFLYDNTLYGVKDFMSVEADNIIYVPTDAEDVKKAIEDRLTTLFGDENHITVSESELTINEFLVRNQMDPMENGDEHYYILKQNNEDSRLFGAEFNVIAIKDSSKINNDVSFKSNDLVTNVSVSTDGKLPLDTLVGVLKLTDGETYNKILKLLNASTGEMYDISLYSNAQDKYITKLDNGKFLISIPVSKELEGKTLTAYYVAEDGKVEEHVVTIKDGFATFETDHFSVYTLVASDKDATANPKTGDNILFYVAILGLSLVGVISVSAYKLRRQ